MDGKMEEEQCATKVEQMESKWRKSRVQQR